MRREWRVCHDENNNRFSVQSFGLITRDIKFIATIGEDNRIAAAKRLATPVDEESSDYLTAKVIADACNSYMRNAHDPHEAAEKDLLRQAIDALHVQIRATASFAGCSKNAATTNAARAVLEKVPDSELPPNAGVKGRSEGTSSDRRERP